MTIEDESIYFFIYEEGMILMHNSSMELDLKGNTFILFNSIWFNAEYLEDVKLVFLRGSKVN
ncbi:MAG: hypothetical protein GF311_18650 [Candidatus Lokiarchaeota archaeon]|nr:hypothetical protein [Candidatus Lokiarchaeota archaeon]